MNDQEVEEILSGSEVFHDGDVFRARVLAGLPSKRPSWLQPAVVTLLGGVGALVAICLLPSPWPGLAHLFRPVLDSLTALTLTGVSALAALTLTSVPPTD
jgi:hypothetical protein